MKVLIDSDLEVLYRAGFASEPTVYYVQGQSFSYKKEAMKYCKEREIDPEEITKEKEYFSLKYAQNVLDGFVEELVQEVKDEYGEQDYSFIHYLTGKTNFRKEVDSEYKAHRSEKPDLLEELKAYIHVKYNGIIEEGYEADDLIGIESQSCRDAKIDFLIVSQDKDLDQLAGLHYNRRRKVFYEVLEDEGIRYLWQQMLTGDRADNVYGIYGVGDKTALKMMDGIPTDELPDLIKQEYEKNGITEKFDKNLTSLTILQQRLKD